MGNTNKGRRVHDPDLVAPWNDGARHRGRHPDRLMRLTQGLIVAFSELLAVLAPVECVCCGAEDSTLCGPCARQVRLLCTSPFRAEGQAPTLLTVDGSVILPVVAAAHYRDELAQALLSFKHLGQGRLASVLAPALGKAVRAAVGNRTDIFLVPIPSSNAAFRNRGFSPVHLLLGHLRRRNALPGLQMKDALKKVKSRLAWRDLVQAALARDGTSLRAGFEDLGAGILGVGTRRRGSGQKGLGRGERVRRVRGSMTVRLFQERALEGKACIIVDDVLTTGATLSEAARALSKAGGVVCGAVVLAATRPPAGSELSAERPKMQSEPTQTKNK
ncbi:ComF family protein [Arthrobacter methylotrophus]|uniref:ComF family protein n=2 Tax=Arthrobacter methylotrophus TaxID=121291 RepID=A0ABV5USC2_9MICC